MKLNKRKKSNENMNLLPEARNENIVVQNLNKEILIYDLQTHRAFCLNETSAIVYRACDGATSFESLKNRFKLTDDLIHLALEQLRDNRLIEGKRSNYFGIISRRAAVRKAGLTTLIALPVISSLIAPTAANAQSSTCVSTGIEPKGAQYIAPTGQCAAVAVGLCCSDTGTFFATGPDPAVDICVCT